MHTCLKIKKITQWFKSCIFTLIVIKGFSQGACLASILSKICADNLASEESSQYKFIRFNFAIIVAGYRSRQSQHALFYDLEKRISIPTFQIYGNGDKVKIFDYFLLTLIKQGLILIFL